MILMIWVSTIGENWVIDNIFMILMTCFQDSLLFSILPSIRSDYYYINPFSGHVSLIHSLLGTNYTSDLVRDIAACKETLKKKMSECFDFTRPHNIVWSCGNLFIALLLLFKTLISFTDTHMTHTKLENVFVNVNSFMNVNNFFKLYFVLNYVERENKHEKWGRTQAKVGHEEQKFTKVFFFFALLTNDKNAMINCCLKWNYQIYVVCALKFASHYETIWNKNWSSMFTDFDYMYSTPV